MKIIATIFLMVIIGLISNLFGYIKGIDDGYKQGVAIVGMCENIKDWPKYIVNEGKALEGCKK